MLKQLYVENFALIRKLNIEFDKGFSVITGETGAGKSILLGALSLILGNRADKDVLFNKEKKCIIEGRFLITGYDMEHYFTANDLDFEDEMVIRREINKNGKSRAFINDTPVTLPIMKEIGIRLVDIHSQNTTLTLNQSEFQLALVDGYARNENLIKEYQKHFSSYKKLKIELSDLITLDEKSRSDLDYFNYQYSELFEAKLMGGEQSDLEKELDILNNSEAIKSALYNASHHLHNSDQDINGRLKEIVHDFSKVRNVFQPINEICERLDSVLIELNDLGHEIDKMEEYVEFDPERIAIIEERLNLIYNLQQKHHVSDVADLLLIQEDLLIKLNDINGLEDQIKSKQDEIIQIKKELQSLAENISNRRKEFIPEIQKQLLEVLELMGMKGAEFHIKQQTIEEFSSFGFDQIHFLFNANKGGELNEISKSASGGELSRLMLGLKSLISNKNLLPTIIFDEIDTGVSGDIAGKVGEIMLRMSNKMQVIAISHLPQIAGKSLNHYFVYKEIVDERTESQIRHLQGDERVEEIAKMLSSGTISDAALQTARELLKN
ncbi:MAG: DNA repair protein RecN [Bacteroidales bacterium]|nr:DNA repair protein RecN [Bacteroidales bacterium]